MFASNSIYAFGNGVVMEVERHHDDGSDCCSVTAERRVRGR